MDKTLTWTPEALDRYKEIIDRIKERWNQREATKFAQAVERTTDLIRRYPMMFRASTVEGHREAVVKPYNILVYRITEEGILVVTVWDMRQHPRRRVLRRR